MQVSTMRIKHASLHCLKDRVADACLYYCPILLVAFLQDALQLVQVWIAGVNPLVTPKV